MPNLHLFTSHAEGTRLNFKSLREYISNSFHVPFRSLPRILFHAVLLSLIIAGFWLMDSLKDPVLARIVGIEYQPIAKVISVLTTLVITCVYDFLTSQLSKANLFHLVSVVFGVVFMIISALLADPDGGLRSSDAPGPHRLLGWVAYVSIECYGSLMVALFWSFTNSVMNLEEAMGAYGLIISIAQFGAIAGSTLATNSKSIGISVLFLAGALSIFSVSLVVKVYHVVFRRKLRSAYAALQTESEFSRERERATSIDEGVPHIVHVGTSNQSSGGVAPGMLNSFWEGIFLIWRDRYLMIIFGVSCAYEVVVTIMDYQFKILAAQESSSNESSSWTPGSGASVAEDQFANLLGHFGQATNICSFFVSFFGFSFLVHRFGVRNSLMIFPAVLFITVVVTNLEPSLPVLFIAVSIVKALVFSLHDPVKELLYIPTSVAVKFKAKAWIDVFGSRVAKATGALVSYMAGGNVSTLRRISEVPCLLLSAGVVILAYTAGNEFERRNPKSALPKNSGS